MLYKKVVIFLATGLFLAGLFFGGVSLYRQRLSVTEPVDTGVSVGNVSHSQLIAEYREATALLNANKFAEAKLKFADYIRFESYLNMIGDGGNIGAAKIQLADSYFYSGEKEKAIKMLQGVTATPTLSSEVRALAFIKLGNYFYETFDQQFVRDVIFGSRETKNLFDGNDLERSASNLYDEATKINPTTLIGYYGRGIYYSNQLLSKNNLSESQRNAYLGHVLDDLRKGDEIFSEIIAGQRSSSAWIQAFAYQLRAKLLFTVQYANPSLKREDEKIRQDFETSIKMYVKSGKPGLRAEYQYIIWMLMSDKVGNADTLKSVTDDFYKKLSIADGTDVRRDTFVEFLKNIRNYPEHHYYLATVLLGENDTRVKDFLMGIGWPQEAFEK